MSYDRPPEGQDPQPPEPGGSPPPSYGSEAQPPAYGSQPEQPPAYGSDAPPPAYGGGTPPPPPPGGGYPPAGPGGPGGGYPPAQGSGSFSVGDAFNYGWQKFQANVGTILLAALAYIAIIAVIELIFFFTIGGLATASTEPITQDGVIVGYETSGGGFAMLLVVGALFAVLITVLSAVMQAGIARGVLGITYGRPISVGTMFTFDNIGAVIVASLIVGVAAGVGTLLCFVPGLIVIFFSQFYVWFIVDKQMGAMDAVKASFTLVNQNLGTMIGFFLAAIVAYVVGAILCGIGLLVAVPVIFIAQGYAYRKLQGEAVAA